MFNQNSAASVLCWPYTNQRIQDFNIGVKILTVEQKKLFDNLLIKKNIYKNCYKLNLKTSIYTEIKSCTYLYNYLQNQFTSTLFSYNSIKDQDDKNRLYIPIKLNSYQNKKFNLIYIQVINGITHFVIKENNNIKNIYIFTNKELKHFKTENNSKFDKIKLINQYPEFFIYLY